MVMYQFLHYQNNNAQYWINEFVDIYIHIKNIQLFIFRFTISIKKSLKYLAQINQIWASWSRTMVGDTAAPIQSRSNRTSSILEGDQATLGGKIVTQWWSGQVCNLCLKHNVLLDVVVDSLQLRRFGPNKKGSLECNYRFIQMFSQWTCIAN